MYALCVGTVCALHDGIVLCVCVLNPREPLLLFMNSQIKRLLVQIFQPACEPRQAALFSIELFYSTLRLT